MTPFMFFGSDRFKAAEYVNHKNNDNESLNSISNLNIIYIYIYIVRDADKKVSIYDIA